MEREKTERERREREERERERREKERREQEEKERQQYQVDQHFNKTFRLAQHKVNVQHHLASVVCQSHTHLWLFANGRKAIESIKEGVERKGLMRR